MKRVFQKLKVGFRVIEELVRPFVRWTYKFGTFASSDLDLAKFRTNNGGSLKRFCWAFNINKISS
jgi:hypothetical protein